MLFPPMIFGWFQVGPMVALVGREPGGVICIGGRVTHPATNHISIILVISLFEKESKYCLFGQQIYFKFYYWMQMYHFVLNMAFIELMNNNDNNNNSIFI